MGDEHAALGGAVEFRDDEAGQADRGVEGLHLGKRVLTIGAVDDENRLVRSAGHGLVLGAADSAQLFHEVDLGGQAAGGVGDDDVGAARLACAHGVEDDCGRIAALLGDDFDLVAVAPDGELFAGGGSERVACGE